MVHVTTCLTFFFFNDPPPPELYPLPLHDALPICAAADPFSRAPSGARPDSRPTSAARRGLRRRAARRRPCSTLRRASAGRRSARRAARCGRSEEHTSELQSQSNLVCRLLLEKKNT